MSTTRMGWKRRVLVGLCAVMLLASACGKKTKEPLAASPVPVPTVASSRPSPAPRKVTVRFAISDVERPIYEELIAAFEQENPDLEIKIVSLNQVLGLGPLGNTSIPDDAERRLVGAADVVKMGVSRATVDQGLVRDLGPLIETDARFEADDFVVGALQRQQWRGGTWALPYTANLRLMFYSKDAFDAAGLAYPQAGWTWDDLAQAAVKVTERQGDAVTRWGFVCPTGLAYRVVESWAGSIADYALEPPMPALDDAKVVEAMQGYARMCLDEGSMPCPKPDDNQNDSGFTNEDALIDQGKAAIWPDLALLFWYRKIQGNVGVVPFPVDTPNGRSTPAWFDTLAMSAGTQVPDAAWRWMVYLTRQGLRSIGQGARSMPARRSAAEASGYWDAIEAELATALRWALEHGYAAPEPVAYEAFADAFDAILSGTTPVAQALGEAQARAENDREAAMLTASGATPAPTFVVSAPAEPASSGRDVKQITFIPGLGSFNLEPYRRLSAAFQELHPEIHVEVKMLDITGAGGGSPDLSSMAKTSDCFQWYPSLQDPKALAAVLSLDPFLEADESLGPEHFYPQLVEPFSQEGRLWGLPADVTPFVIEYNRDLFDAARVPYPTAGWTWDEFLTAATALTEGEGETKQYGYVAEVYESNDLLLMLTRLGAQLVDDRATPPAFTLNDPSVIEAMRWYTGLTTDYGAKPAFITNITKLLGASSAYLDREALINEGRAAMWTNSGTMAAVFGPREGLDIGVAPLPRRADGAGRASLLTTSGYFVSAQTKEPLACWQWITFLTEQTEAVQGYPARRSLAESVAYQQLVGEERAAAYRSSVADAEQPSSLDLLTEEDWLGGVFLWLSQAYGKILDGEAGVEEALDEAQTLAEGYRDCMIAAGDYSRPSWQGCLKATDPTLPDFLFAQGG